MTPLEKYRQQVAIAKASEPGVKRYVVQTADEAQALLDQIDAPVGIINEEHAAAMAKLIADGPHDFWSPRGVLVRVPDPTPRPIDPPGDDEVV